MTIFKLSQLEVDVLEENDRLWDQEALDKALNPQQKRVRIPDQNKGIYGMASVRGDKSEVKLECICRFSWQWGQFVGQSQREGVGRERSEHT